jgi:multicomponent Na+:H+ antiporter subunit G
MDLLASLFLLLGTLMLVVAAVGVVKLPDALSRQHAATKAGTLALALLCLGAVLSAPAEGSGWRLLAIVLVLLLTMPVASHLLARAAARECYSAEELEDAPRVEPRRP